MNQKTLIENGVYIVLKDGSYAPLNESAAHDKSEVAFVGIAYDGHTFGVHLSGSKGDYPLINTPNCEYPEDDCCFKNEWDALVEWDFVKHTRHIQEIGTDIPLEDGEYLPTPACLMVMCHYQKRINNALESVGGEPIDFGSSIWSCLRYSSSHAWCAYGSYGFFYNGSMYLSYAAIPLSLWNPA